MIKKTNNLEVEIKFLLSDREAKRLDRNVRALAGVESRGRFYERNIMFDDDGGRMHNEDARLRVRQIGNDKGISAIEFAYKRRLKASGPVKKEEEIEVAFSGNADQFIAILGKMGYSMTTSYERYRTTYTYRSLKVTFDEFPFGAILEIEGAERGIMRMCTQLGLDVGRSTLESCDDVYDRLCRERGIVVRDHIEFTDRTMPRLS